MEKSICVEVNEKVLFVCSSGLLRNVYVKIYVDPNQVRAELGGGRKEFSMADADAAIQQLKESKDEINATANLMGR